MEKVHPLCVAKALRVAERLAFYEYTYLHAWGASPPPSKHDLEKLIDDLSYLKEACIPDERARRWIDAALEDVQDALTALKAGEHGIAKDRVRDAHAALLWAMQYLSER